MGEERRSVRQRAALLLALGALVAGACGGAEGGGAAGAEESAPRTRAAAAPRSLAAAVARVRSELRGIPQHGLLLGRPGAPVSIVEYADLACPTCARIHVAVVPALIARYVRSGQASLEFRTIARGPRSRELAVSAHAASPQRRGWQFIQLAYLRSVLSGKRGPSAPAESSARLVAALGLGVPAWRSDLRRPEWASSIRAAASVAAVARFASYPVFLVRGREDDQAFVVLAQPRSVGEFARAIAKAHRAG